MQDSIRRKIPLLLILLPVSLIALWPGGGQEALDARTWQPNPDFQLEKSSMAIAVEPFLALGDILAGSPDYRKTIIAFFLWAFGLSVLHAACVNRGCPGRTNILRGLKRAVFISSLILGYLLCFLMLRLPGWKLTSQSDDYLIIDPQTHTFESHDGVISARENLECHQQQGFDLVAITEHNHTRGSENGQRLCSQYPELPQVICGLEMRERGGAWLLGFGRNLKLDKEVIRQKDLKQAENFIKHVKGAGSDASAEPGLVIALSYRIKPDDVTRLVHAGVDGFELVNYGHPDLSKEVRNELLRASREDGVLLLASTDWHGWSGFCNTWTAVRIPGIRRQDRSTWRSELHKALLAGNPENVLPLCATRMGAVSWASSLMSPFTETLRYARGLSPIRLSAWWLWAAFLALVCKPLRFVLGAVRRPLLSLFMLLVSLALVYKGASLLLYWNASFDGRDLVLQTGAASMIIGLLYMAAALYRILRNSEVEVQVEVDKDIYNLVSETR